MARKKKTASQKAYSKEVSRIKRQIKSLEKRGYTVNVTIPKTTKGAKNLTLEKLYEKSTYTTVEGKTIKGKVAREQERSRSAIKARDTRRRHEYYQRSGKQYTHKAGNKADIVITNYETYVYDTMAYLEEPVAWVYDRLGRMDYSNLSMIRHNEEVRKNILSQWNAIKNNTDHNKLAKAIESLASETALYGLVDSVLHGYNPTIVISAQTKLLEVITAGKMNAHDMSDLQQADEYYDVDEDWNDI